MSSKSISKIDKIHHNPLYQTNKNTPINEMTDYTQHPKSTKHRPSKPTENTQTTRINLERITLEIDKILSVYRNQDL